MNKETAKIVLEIGGNAMGDLKLAEEMVRQASKCAIWAVKFQAYRVRDFIHRDNPAYEELLGEEMDFGDLASLIKLSHDLSLRCGITVFDPSGIDLAHRAGADFIKLSSGDINYLYLLKALSRSQLPLVLSTGASSQSEVDRALSLFDKPPLALLQCSSIYPCAKEDINLSVMDNWLNLGLPAGLSDHSLGIDASILALQMGAVMVEKHFTTDPKLPGGDNSMSIDPRLAEDLSLWEKAPKLDPSESPYWGKKLKKPLSQERPDLIRRHAVAGKDLKKGAPLKESQVKFLRVSHRKNPKLITADSDITKLIPNRDIPEDAVLLEEFFT